MIVVATTESRCTRMFGPRRLNIEGLVSVMAIDAFEVRVCRGMRLYITLNGRRVICKRGMYRMCALG